MNGRCTRDGPVWVAGCPRAKSGAGTDCGERLRCRTSGDCDTGLVSGVLADVSAAPLGRSRSCSGCWSRSGAGSASNGFCSRSAFARSCPDLNTTAGHLRRVAPQRHPGRPDRRGAVRPAGHGGPVGTVCDLRRVRRHLRRRGGVLGARAGGHRDRRSSPCPGRTPGIDRGVDGGRRGLLLARPGLLRRALPGGHRGRRPGRVGRRPWVQDVAAAPPEARAGTRP